jgi:ComF family protein
MLDSADLLRRRFPDRFRSIAARAAQLASGFPGAALDLVFPATCLSCGGQMDAGSPGANDLFCSTCVGEFAFVAAGCERCAAPLPPAGAGCLHCNGRRFWFHAAVAAGRYTGRLRELVLRMKRSDENPVSLAMGKLIWQRCGPRLTAAGIDLVVPVPMHWRRRMAHGTNSAALLAEVLAGRLRLPAAYRILRRRRHTAPQFSLSTRERRANVRGAFSVRAGKRLEGAHVLLVDDIMTSGATCNEAARILRDAGARRVTVVVAARATSQ